MNRARINTIAGSKADHSRESPREIRGVGHPIDFAVVCEILRGEVDETKDPFVVFPHANVGLERPMLPKTTSSKAKSFAWTIYKGVTGKKEQNHGRER